MSTAMLETYCGSWCNIIIEQIKFCIKLVINSSLHYVARSENKLYFFSYAGAPSHLPLPNHISISCGGVAPVKIMSF
jgi:hypothetical protein